MGRWANVAGTALSSAWEAGVDEGIPTVAGAILCHRNGRIGGYLRSCTMILASVRVERRTVREHVKAVKVKVKVKGVDAKTPGIRMMTRPAHPRAR